MNLRLVGSAASIAPQEMPASHRYAEPHVHRGEPVQTSLRRGPRPRGRTNLRRGARRYAWSMPVPEQFTIHVPDEVLADR